MTREQHRFLADITEAIVKQHPVIVIAMEWGDADDLDGLHTRVLTNLLDNRSMLYMIDRGRHAVEHEHDAVTDTCDN